MILTEKIYTKLGGLPVFPSEKQLLTVYSLTFFKLPCWITGRF